MKDNQSYIYTMDQSKRGLFAAGDLIEIDGQTFRITSAENSTLRIVREGWVLYLYGRICYWFSLNFRAFAIWWKP